jgi:hypothetical protein
VFFFTRSQRRTLVRLAEINGFGTAYGQYMDAGIRLFELTPKHEQAVRKAASRPRNADCSILLY